MLFYIAKVPLIVEPFFHTIFFLYAGVFFKFYIKEVVLKKEKKSLLNTDRFG